MQEIYRRSYINKNGRKELKMAISYYLYKNTDIIEILDKRDPGCKSISVGKQ